MQITEYKLATRAEIEEAERNDLKLATEKAVRFTLIIRKR